MLILAFAAVLVAGAILGVAGHAWLNRQKTSTLDLDKLKIAAELIHSVAVSQADAHLIAAAQERQAATRFALAQLSAKITPLMPEAGKTVLAAPPVA